MIPIYIIIKLTLYEWYIKYLYIYSLIWYKILNYKLPHIIEKIINKKLIYIHYKLIMAESKQTPAKSEAKVFTKVSKGFHAPPKDKALLTTCFTK